MPRDLDWVSGESAQEKKLFIINQITIFINSSGAMKLTGQSNFW